MRNVILFFLLTGFMTAQAQSYFPSRNNSMKVQPTADIKAYGFDLRDVKLLPGSPFYNAMEKDAAYLLSLDPDRLLHRFYLNAGLPTKGDIYGGWENMGLSGHTLGHYLSACAMMYVSTGQESFRQRVDHIVSELARCQTARKTGYVGAIPGEDSIFWKVQHGIIKTAGFDLNGGWSPWYTVHKVMGGLVDAWLFCNNTQALKVVTGMADWTGNILKDLNDEQLEKMRLCEYGGMNDVLVNIYEITGEKRYLDLSFKFHDQFVLGQLEKKIDALQGRHSNTNVPKAIGCARRYDLTGREGDRTIATFFWDTMVGHHSYVIGGNSNYEYLGPPDKLNNRLSDNTCETCNTYNMLKLTRYVFSWNPDAQKADYYERALYNHILASQNPETGMMCYFVPLRMGAQKQFSDPDQTFTCCVGSGMENHSKYAEGIYAEGKDGSLMVNLFIPSVLQWKSKGVTVRQETSFPEEGRTRLTISAIKPVAFALRLRQPGWATGDITFTRNGKPVKAARGADGYWTINATWGRNDVMEIALPMNLHTVSMPDNPQRVAIMYGPVVLAGQLGTKMPDPVFGTTVLLTDNHDVSAWAIPVKDKPLTFASTVSKPDKVELIPFYRTYQQYYNVYWDYFTQKEWTAREQEYLAERKHQAEVEEKTIDYIRIGEMQPERDHQLKASEKSYVSDALGRMGREARSGGFFSFTMTVLADTPSQLLCTYIGDDDNRAFDLLVDGVRVGTQELHLGQPGRFFDITYPIPSELLKSKSKVTVTIQAHENKTAGRVFGCRIVKQ